MTRRIIFLTWLLVLGNLPAHATNYYISPSGSNGNTGLSPASPWLTFAHAINAARAWCGDTLILLDGTYGDGASTGKLVISGLPCTSTSRFVVAALNSRKAKIVDSGSGRAVYVFNSPFVTLDGLVMRSTDAPASSGTGQPLLIRTSNFVIVRNSICMNPNRFKNLHCMSTHDSTDNLFEDNEGYVFNRHCVELWHGHRHVVRRQYCNPRDGMPPGGIGPGVGRADALASMYPCSDCIVENSIAEGPMYLNEMNATFATGILQSGSKVLGSICVNCSSGNGVYINARSVQDLNHAPQNNLVQHTAFVNFTSASSAVRISNGMGNVVDHLTVIGNDTGGNGPSADASECGSGPCGATPQQTSVIYKNSVVMDRAGTGFNISQQNTWSGDRLWSFSNGVAFSPGLPANWTNASTSNPQLGTCKLWIPSGSPLKNAASDGGDIGATILYRYQDGVLTDIPLWDTTTGAFPFGDADLDGTNRVAGASLFDVHMRLNINAGGCSFPTGYGGSAGPARPETHVTGVGISSANANLAMQPGDDGLLVGVVAYSNTGNVGTIDTPVSSCGSQSIGALPGGEVVTSSPYRRVKVFGVTSPNSGTCTISVTTSGSVDAVGMVAIRIPVMGAFGTPAVGVHPVGVATATPNVTVATNTGETVIDFVAGKCVPTGGACTTTWSVGADQTWQSDAQATVGDIRLIVSEQDGTDGGHMSHTAGQVHLWGTVAVPIIHSPPDPPSTSTHRVSNYRIDSLHGTVATPEVSLGALAPQNVAAEIGATGEFRLRVEIIVENAPSTSTGIHPYCKKVGGSFVSVGNSFGSGFVRYYGAGAEPTIPASLTRTTQRFSGTFFPGYTSRDSALPVTVPVMLVGTRTEIDYQFAAGNGLAAGDVLECEIRRDDGSTLGTHTNPLRVNIVGPRASMGF